MYGCFLPSDVDTLAIINYILTLKFITTQNNKNFPFCSDIYLLLSISPGERTPNSLLFVISGSVIHMWKTSALYLAQCWWKIDIYRAPLPLSCSISAWKAPCSLWQAQQIGTKSKISASQGSKPPWRSQPSAACHLNPNKTRWIQGDFHYSQ